MLRDFLSSREYMTRRNGSLPRFVVGIRENVSSSLSVSLPSSRIQHFCFVIAIILRVEIILSVLCGTLSVLLSKCLFLFFREFERFSIFCVHIDYACRLILSVHVAHTYKFMYTHNTYRADIIHIKLKMFEFSLSVSR